jgi:hypothetical protein
MTFPSASAIPLRTITRIGPDGAPLIEVFGELDIVTAKGLTETTGALIKRHGTAVTVGLAGVPRLIWSPWRPWRQRLLRCARVVAQ